MLPALGEISSLGESQAEEAGVSEGAEAERADDEKKPEEAEMADDEKLVCESAA